MIYSELNSDDIRIYRDDIYSCYNSNKFIFDSQNYLLDANLDGLSEFLEGFITSPDSMVVGLFDDNRNFLYGIVIFDSIRFGQLNLATAEVHIAVDRKAFGKLTLDLLRHLRDECGFTTLFCHIPDIANRAIGLCKRLEFKKTGYIPNCLPYINLKGEEKLHDVQIWTYNKPNINNELLEEEEVPF